MIRYIGNSSSYSWSTMSSTAVDGIFGSVFWQLLPHPQKSVHGSLLYLHLQLPPLHPLVHFHDTNWTTESGATGVLLVRGTYCPSIFIQLHSFGSLMSIVSLIDLEFCLIWWKARSTCCYSEWSILRLFCFLQLEKLFRSLPNNFWTRK